MPAPGGLPPALADLADRSAAPEVVAAALARLLERPGAGDRLTDGGTPSRLAATVVRVVGASNSLGRLCVADPGALDVLAGLDAPVALPRHDRAGLARAKRLELLRIAARDLGGMDPLEAVGEALATLGDEVLDGALVLAATELGRDPGSGGMAVVGMGKLGGRELNYASDVDVLLVTDADEDDALGRRLLAVARDSVRVDAALRPGGRAGGLSMSVARYRAYWERWAAAWEFQALIKARPVAGDGALGRRFADEAAAQLWGRRFRAEELTEIRAMKARSEAIVSGRGMAARELKRAPGGIRDVEFALQLLQLVHGHHDPSVRSPTTLDALSAMAAAGYIADEDATVLADAYRFLRTVEHRVQLLEEEQTHAVPAEPSTRRRLAKVLGYEDDAAAAAEDHFDEELRARRAAVRAIHERLFFRPLLEAFSALPEGRLSLEAQSERLAAFGFGDVERTRAAVAELAGGLSRTSRLLEQMLPLLLDWLSLTPDPDLGLLGLRTLLADRHRRSLVASAFRESPEAARRLCVLLGSSRLLAHAIAHDPDVIAELDGDAMAATGRDELVVQARERVAARPNATARRTQLRLLWQDQLVRTAARDLLDIDTVEATGAALAASAEAVLEAALEAAHPQVPMCVIGMGRLGGAELAYGSDLDVVFVHGEGGSQAAADHSAERAVNGVLRLLHGPSPADGVVRLDLALRPEGRHGRVSRDLAAFETYLERFGETWERQALLRARVVAGDRDLGARFMALADEATFGRGLSPADVTAVRRMKARVERERVPAKEDPKFHLKLGPGSLADIEWTVQLLQWQHGRRGASTLAVLEDLAAGGVLGEADAATLREAYRFCERVRNRWHLVGALGGGAPAGDALPSDVGDLSRLARSLGTTAPALRETYRRVTRRARASVERLFYGR